MLQLDWNVLWTIVNVLILFAALRIFLWKPVQKIIEKRQNTITDSLTKAKQAEADATKKKEEYEASINNANEQALEILATAKARAQAEYEAKIEAALLANNFTLAKTLSEELEPIITLLSQFFQE